MSDTPDRVERTVELDAPPERVWEALVDPDVAPEWFGEEFAIDARPGGRVTVADGGGARRGTVEVAEPPHRLTLRVWEQPAPGRPLDGSRIDFVIEPEPPGRTRLTVTETRLASRRPGARAGSAGGRALALAGVA